MKLKSFAALIMSCAMIFSLNGCASSSPKEPNTQSPVAEKEPEKVPEKPAPAEKVPDQAPEKPVEPKPVKDYSHEYEDFFEPFFYLFSEGDFHSAKELYADDLLLFTMVEMVKERSPEACPYSYNNEMDVFNIPVNDVLDQVGKYFDTNGVDFSNSVWYSEDKTMFEYPGAHSFPIAYPHIDSISADGDMITVTVNYTNPEREGNPVVKTMKFTFQELTDEDGSYLKTISGETIG